MVLCLIFFLLRDGNNSLAESIAELPSDDGKVTHAAGSCGLPPVGLDGPVVATDSLGRIPAVCAGLLLDVEGHLSTPAAEGVSLVPPLTKRTGSLCHVDFVSLF